MSLEVLDVTDLLRQATWSKVPTVTQAWFADRGARESTCQRVLASCAGLYVLYFENDARAVHDKNGGWRDGGLGKMVIAREGASLKPGKFEGGFVRRRHQDADHMHRRRSDAFGTTFTECLRLAFLLDLTPHPHLVRRGEATLKAHLKQFIVTAPRTGLAPGANWRGDWRLLADRIPLPDLRTSLPIILKAAVPA